MVSKASKKITFVYSYRCAVSSICSRLLAEIREKNYSSEAIFAIHLALEEAILNAIEHGNQFDSAKKVDIYYQITDEKCDITVADEGPGFDPDSLPDPRTKENLYKPSGRGVLLIKSYMDIVEFNECGNTVHMIKFNR